MPALCPSSVPVDSVDACLEKIPIQRLLRTLEATVLKGIDEAVADWKRGADVAAAAGFAGIQLHAQKTSFYLNSAAHTQIDEPMNAMEVQRGA